MRRKKVLLLILGGVLILSIAYAYWSMPRQETAPSRTAMSGAKPASKSSAGIKGKPATRLYLELMDVEFEPFPGSGRDIFRVRSRWTPPVMAPVTVVPVTEAPPPPPPPPPTAEELMQQSLSGYRVLGFLDKGEARSVFLSSGSDVLVLKSGKTFGDRNKFIVTEITATELVISSADRSVSVRVALDELANHEPAVMSPVSVPRPAVGEETDPSSPAASTVRRPRIRPSAAIQEEVQEVQETQAEENVQEADHAENE
jgi:hypothetical protein